MPPPPRPERRRQTTSRFGSALRRAFRCRSLADLARRCDRVATFLAPQPDEDRHRVAAQRRGGRDVGRGDEFPTALHDAAHQVPPATDAREAVEALCEGGGASSPRNRSAATRERSDQRPIQRKRIPNALMRRGQWKAFETVSGVDCAWCNEFHHFTEK